MKDKFLKFRLFLIGILAGRSPVILNAEIQGGLVVSNCYGALISNCRFIGNSENVSRIVGNVLIAEADFIVE